jgi:hypothetical protein
MKAKERKSLWKQDTIANYGVIVKVVNGSNPLLTTLAHSSITRERYMMDTKLQFLSWAAFDLGLGSVMAQMLFEQIGRTM